MAVRSPSKRPLHRSMQAAQYLAVRVLGSIPAAAGTGVGQTLARSVGRLVDASNERRRQRMHQNIALAFPEMSAEEVRATSRASMEHLMEVILVDAQIMHRMITEATWPGRLVLESAGPFLERLIRREPMVVLTAHYGNWEMLGFALAALTYPIDAVIAKPLKNDLIYEWILRIRQAYGTRIVEQEGAIPLFNQLLNCGGRVGTTADQNAGDQGVFVPFFGRLASSYKAIAMMAMTHDVPVAIGCAQRSATDQIRYHLHPMDIIEPDDWADHDDPLFYITARYNRAIENMIRLDPTQYLWLHRRWKSRPNFERKGKPMPSKLIDKIAALPWMTDVELARIVGLSNHPPTDAASPNRH